MAFHCIQGAVSSSDDSSYHWIIQTPEAERVCATTFPLKEEVEEALLHKFFARLA